MFDESVFPQWLTSYLVDDDRFGAAYDAVPADRRAWLKTTIARLHTLYGTPGVIWGRHERQWRQEFVTVAESRPVDWTIVVLGPEYVSAPRLLAGLLMPLLAGVAHVLVVRQESADGWPDAVLAGLELAGQEAAVSLPEDRVTALMAEMQGKGAGRFLLFGSAAQIGIAVCCTSSFSGSQVQGWQEPSVSGIAISQGAGVDEDLLAWAHPDWQITTIDMADPENEYLLEERPYAAFVGAAECVDQVPDSIPCMLGIGQEGCWIWPDLEPNFFLQRRLSLLSEI